MSQMNTGGGSFYNKKLMEDEERRRRIEEMLLRRNRMSLGNRILEDPSRISTPEGRNALLAEERERLKSSFVTMPNRLSLGNRILEDPSRTSTPEGMDALLAEERERLKSSLVPMSNRVNPNDVAAIRRNAAVSGRSSALPDSSSRDRIINNVFMDNAATPAVRASREREAYRIEGKDPPSMAELVRRYAAERDRGNVEERDRGNVGSYDPTAMADRLRQNASSINDRPDYNPQLDPASARAYQNRLLAQQRAVDSQIRALRRQRARGGELSPEQIQELANLEQQAVELRRAKVGAFRLANELEGRGPLSPSEAEASRQRLADQIPDARRQVLEQARNERDIMFRRQAEREAAGVPDYRPEGMVDQEADRLYNETAGPTPSQARQNFLNRTREGANIMTPDDRDERDRMMENLRSQEVNRQARERRANRIRGMEQEAALDAQEVRAALPQIQAETDVQRARNAQRGAGIESRGMDLAEAQVENEIERLKQLAPASIAAEKARLEAEAEEMMARRAQFRDSRSEEAMAVARQERDLMNQIQMLELEGARKQITLGEFADPAIRSSTVENLSKQIAYLNGEEINDGRVGALQILIDTVEEIEAIKDPEERRRLARDVVTATNNIQGTKRLELRDDITAPLAFALGFVNIFDQSAIDHDDPYAPSNIVRMRRRREALGYDVIDKLNRMAWGDSE